MKITVKATARPGMTGRDSSPSGDAELVLVRDVPELEPFRVPVAATTLSYSCRVMEYRWSDGKFYRLYLSRDRVEAKTAGQPEAGLEISLSYDSLDGITDRLQEAADKLIIVDGSVWIETPEPAFIIDFHGHEIVAGNPKDISPWRVFSLKEPEAAVEAAARCRAKKGIKGDPRPSAVNPPADVLLPEAFTGPLHEERMNAVAARAADAVAEVVAVLDQMTPESFDRAARLLVQASDDFTAGTSGLRWQDSRR